MTERVRPARSASHIYAEPGVYGIDLTVSVGGAKASDSTSATVTAP